MKKAIILILVLVSNYSNAQPKFLTYGYEPVVDPFTQEIYYYKVYMASPTLIDRGVFKTNFTGDYEELTEFDLVPIFANTKHKAVFWDYDDYFCYEYDFDSKTKKTLFNTTRNFTPRPFYFPDDNKLLLNTHIFDLVADTMKILSEDEYLFNDYYPITDSTFLYIDNMRLTGYDYLVEMNINTLMMDTLLSIKISAETRTHLLAFAYNAKEKLVAISVYIEGVYNILSIYDLNSDDKKLIYSEKLYKNGWLETVYMSWNEENNKLLLVGNSVINSYCAIDVFSLKDSSLKNVSGNGGPPYGLLSQISWVDTSNIVYVGDPYYYSGIYIHNIDVETDIIEKASKIITDFSLAQNYPNPFNPTTTISYQLPAFSHVKLSVCNILGQEVAVLVNKEQPIGKYEVAFDGSSLTSGVYIYTLTTNTCSISKKMLLAK